MQNLIEYMPYVWTLSLILCVLMEAATAALTTIWFMPAGFLCLVLSLFNVPVPIQVIVYVIVAGLTLVMAKIILKRREKKVQKTPTNADRLIGERAVVTVAIDNLAAKGEVTVKGQVWSARSDAGETIDAGEQVTILRIEGVKLVVGKNDGAKNTGW